GSRRAAVLLHVPEDPGAGSPLKGTKRSRVSRDLLRTRLRRFRNRKDPDRHRDGSDLESVPVGQRSRRLDLLVLNESPVLAVEILENRGFVRDEDPRVPPGDAAIVDEDGGARIAADDRLPRLQRNTPAAADEPVHGLSARDR